MSGVISRRSRVFPAADGRLRAMDAAGVSTYAMAAALGTTRDAVFRRRMQLGLPKRVVRLRRGSEPSVWMPERVAELKRLRGEGLDYEAIAARMGVTKDQAIGAARRAGMAKALPPRPKLTPYQREILCLYRSKGFSRSEYWAAALASPEREAA